MSPRVLFLDHAAALGGAELYLLDVLRQRRADGVGAEDRVILFEDGPLVGRLREAGVAVEVVTASARVQTVAREAGPRQALRAAPALVGQVLRLRRAARAADVVFANSQKALVVGALAAALARRPLVWNLHDILTAAHFSRFNARIAVGVANRFARRVIVNSEATRASFVEAGGDAARAHVVYNGIDPAPFDAVTEADVARVRAELGLTSAYVVGVFSRFSAWKGQHVLIEALAGLPAVHALFVGEALFGEDARYAADLRARVAALGLGARVHFAGFRADVPALMRAVDVVAHTSTAPEPFGRVIVEGMLAGKPVVATAAGGALEIVEDGVTGLLVPPGDAGALRAALARLAAAPEMASALGAAGRKNAAERFGLAAVAALLTRHVDAARR